MNVTVQVQTSVPPGRAMLRIVLKAVNATGSLVNASNVSDVSITDGGVLQGGTTVRTLTSVGKQINTDANACV